MVAPCGDFYWFSKIELSESLSYTGANIAEEIVVSNSGRYTNTQVKFVQLDLSKDPLPESGIIIIRDCLVHLSFKDIAKVINAVKSSNSKY